VNTYTKMESEQIKELLIEASRQFPDNVIANLRQGDLVHKASGLYYEIDDPDVYQRIADVPPGTVPFSNIYKLFKSDERNTMRTFVDEGIRKDGKTILPYSRAVELGQGTCLEKSVAVQLAAQGARDSFLINGCLRVDDFFGFHAYNIVFKDGNPSLLDVENPILIEKDGKQTLVPYIVPVLGINQEGIIFQNSKFNSGRTYELF